MSDNPTKAWWIDTESNLDDKTFGDEITGLLTEERLNHFLKLEQASTEEPEEKEKVTVSQVDKLRALVVILQSEKKELQDKLAKTPKGVHSAKLELETVKAELNELKQARTKTETSTAEAIAALKLEIKNLEDKAVDVELKSDEDIKYLTDMVNEIEKTWKAPKPKKESK